MNSHKSARMTPLGRAAMINRILQEGWSAGRAAEAFAVSQRTVFKWLARYRSEGPSGLSDRRSTARRIANRLGEPWIEMLSRLRRDYRLTGAEIAERLWLARSTVAAHLSRLGMGKLKQLEPQPPVQRYQRQHAGELLHLDIKKLARFERVGHRITGDRRNASDGAGWEYAHVAVDNAIRLAYVELLPGEGRQFTTGFLVRVLRWFRERSIRIQRVMTDNGSGYISRLFAKVCRWLQIRHIRTRHYTPRTTARLSASSRLCLGNGPTPFPTRTHRLGMAA
jgi:transposase